MNLKIDTILPVLGIFPEKYQPNGYFENMDIEKKLEIMSGIDGLNGLAIPYPLTSEFPDNTDKLVKLIKSYNLSISSVFMKLWHDSKWKYGAYSTNQKKVRSEAVKTCKETIDFSKEVNADMTVLWPAHDGFDYPFQTNYKNSWENLIETIREIASYDMNIKIAIEYKSKDPRQFFYISNVGRLIIVLNEIKLDNLGGVLDTGHAFMAGENIAEALTIINRYNKLFQVHLSDNYRDADPDLITGTLNFWENIEFFYYLNKYKFDGWFTLDIITPRDDRVKSLKLGVRLTKKYNELAEKLLKYDDEIERNLNGYCFADNMNLILDILLS